MTADFTQRRGLAVQREGLEQVLADAVAALVFDAQVEAPLSVSADARLPIKTAAWASSFATPRPSSYRVARLVHACSRATVAPTPGVHDPLR